MLISHAKIIGLEQPLKNKSLKTDTTEFASWLHLILTACSWPKCFKSQDHTNLLDSCAVFVCVSGWKLVLQHLEKPVIRMAMVVTAADCNLHTPDPSIHQGMFLLDTVDGTLPLLSSVFLVSVGQILLLSSIFQMGKLRNTEVKTLTTLSWSVALPSEWLTISQNI